MADSGVASLGSPESIDISLDALDLSSTTTTTNDSCTTRCNDSLELSSSSPAMPVGNIANAEEKNMQNSESAAAKPDGTPPDQTGSDLQR